MGFLSNIGGGLGGFGDTLFGTEGDAQKRNEANVQRALALLAGVPIEQLFAQARGQISDAPEKAVREGFGRAIGAVGQAGTEAQQGVQAATTAGIGDARQQLLQRGLFGSSMLTQATQGARQQGARTSAGIMGNVAGAQGGLFAAQGQALGNMTDQRQRLLASLFTGEAGALMGRAGAGANVLGNVQYQGTPGLLGPLLGAAAGGFAGGIGTGAAGSLFQGGGGGGGSANTPGYWPGFAT